MPRRSLIPLTLLMAVAFAMCGVLALMGRFQTGAAPHPSSMTARLTPPVVLSVSPELVQNTGGDITITGAEFVATPTVTLNHCGLMPVTLTNVTLTGTTAIRAAIPAGTPEGIYTLTVYNPDGGTNEASPALVSVVRPGDNLTSTWSATTALDMRRIGSSAVAAGGNLYVVGGFSAASESRPGLRTVQRAPIGPDGGLGQWQPATELVSPRGMVGVAATDQHLYAVGGALGLGLPSERGVERAAILPDGSLGPWEVVAQLPEVRYEAAVAVAAGHLFVMDGWAASGGDYWPADTLRAAIAPDGSLGPWEPVAGTAGRSKQAVVAGGTIFVLNDDGSIERTTVGPGGAIAPWQPVAPTARNHTGGAIAAFDGHLFVLGGQGGGEGCTYALTSVERAAINPDGSLSPWTAAPSLHAGRSGLTAAGGEHALYAIGGEEDVAVGAVWAGASVEIASSR